ELRVRRDIHDVLTSGVLIAIANHGIRSGGLKVLCEFTGFGAVNISAWVCLVAILVDRFEDLGAGGLGGGDQLLKACFDLRDCPLTPHPHEVDLLQAQLAALDLGDPALILRVAADPSGHPPAAGTPPAVDLTTRRTLLGFEVEILAFRRV